MDVDTTSGKWAHADILDRVGRGEVDVLLGTQMIAKGLDFPNVTLVGVIDADVGINLPDFRASERTFQLLSQVAGRAGRGPKGGLVIIQTRVPSHHAVRCAVTHDYEAFVAEELPGREDPPYPPTVRLANVVFSGVAEAETVKFALAAGAWFETALSELGQGAVAMIGPAPMPGGAHQAALALAPAAPQHQAGTADPHRAPLPDDVRGAVARRPARDVRPGSGGAAVIAARTSTIRWPELSSGVNTRRLVDASRTDPAAC